MTTVFHALLYGRFIEIQSNHRRKKLHRTNQGSNLFGGSFSNNDNVRVAIAFGRERQPQHLKRLFFPINKPIHFYFNSTTVVRLVKQRSAVFPAFKSSSHFLPQYLTDQIPVHKPIPIVATDQMLDYT